MTQLADRFRQFARRQCAGIAPLYETLALAIAEDAELLAIAAHANRGPASNLFFAAVHRLLLVAHADDPLARYYRSLVPHPEPPANAPGPFRSFCLAHAPEIMATLAIRSVNTNEVQRCACLLPAFAWVARNAPGALLHLIEIGASAGLNLRWDRYAYRYSNGQHVGPDDAPVILDCSLRGPISVDLPNPWPPAIGQRIGIDIDPIDPEDPDDLLWLRALIWPDRWERAARLERAVAAARDVPIAMLGGDGAALLPEALARLPSAGTAVIYHSFMLNQISQAARAAFSDAIGAAAARRTLFLVALEWATDHTAVLTGARLDGTRREERLLARCDSHGAWLEPHALGPAGA